MKLVNNLTDTLNGGYRGLYNEVVTEDCYKIKTLDFIPDLVIDLGANVGVFTRYARSLFPEAKIVAVEPNENNFYHLRKFTKDSNIVLINKAIGEGNVWHATTAVNGSGECYLSEGLGYPKELIEKDAGNLEKSFVPTIMLNTLIDEHLQPGMKSLLKLDIEGAENIIWNHGPSMKALKQIDFITCELHFYAHTGGETHQRVVDTTNKALKSFENTHVCELNHIHFYATKKNKLKL